ncbi:hypothetical protein DPMN_068042 [Dreissena polymorpha]|uniref:Uncharacterized protein n=1 Tax=Dreissena polymorpha TaxID=45954 RepID=A0A9D4BU00_DREPO|nr:hypothetical protein DPMN_068042 [Dreissena polymorpha]
MLYGLSHEIKHEARCPIMSDGRPMLALVWEWQCDCSVTEYGKNVDGDKVLNFWRFKFPERQRMMYSCSQGIVSCLNKHRTTLVCFVWRPVASHLFVIYNHLRQSYGSRMKHTVIRQ